MKKVLYQDEEYELIAYNENDKVLHYLPSDGEFVLVLPYKKSFSKMEFLVKREMVAAWDNHPDYCSLSIPLKYQPEVSAAYVIKEECDVKVEQKHLHHLGVCAASKRADDTFYLYAIDCSQYSENFETDNTHWVDEETLLKSNDAQLITAWARFKYLL